MTSLLLQIVATFTFTNGARVEISRDTTQENPVAIHVTQGVRSATQRLDNNSARGFAYAIAYLSTLGKTTLYPDSVSMQARQFLGFTTTVSCGKSWGCRASIFNVQLWGSNYSYLRPGPLPLAECLRFGQALMQASGMPVVGAPPWPYVWRQP